MEYEPETDLLTKLQIITRACTEKYPDKLWNQITELLIEHAGKTKYNQPNDKLMIIFISTSVDIINDIFIRYPVEITKSTIPSTRIMCDPESIDIIEDLINSRKGKMKTQISYSWLICRDKSRAKIVVSVFYW